jgi:hypothetical protein
MLIKVSFAFRASYIRQRGRSTISSDFLSEEIIEIAEVQAEEARMAYRLVPERGLRNDDGVSRRPATRSIMEWQGRLYWPVMDGTGARHIDVRRWGLELGKPAGRHTERSRRKAGALPDVLGLTSALRGRQWPLWRMESMPIRTVVESNREVALAHLRREAARLLLIGNRLYCEGTEPVWLLRANINHFDVIPQPLRLDAVDCTTPGVFDGPIRDEPLVPFLHYETFRADREKDARRLISERLAADPLGRDNYFTPDLWRIEVGEAIPDNDTLTPMLLGLHDCVGGMVSWAIAAVRRETPSLSSATDDEIAAFHGPDYLKRLVGLKMMPLDSSARRMSGWIADVLQRLDGVDTRIDISGHVESVLRGLRRAAERAQLDIAAGLVPLTEEDREEQGPLAWLACA